MRLLRSGVAIVLLGSMATASLAGRVPEAAFADATEAAGLDFVHENGATGELYTPEIMGPGGALIDYDRDGDLDAYLIQGHRLGANTGEVVTSVDRLYRNDLHFPTGESAGESARGAVRFADVTVTAGLSPTAYGMGVATGDYDNDGWPDLYLANLGSNELRRNNGDGTFSDVTDEAGVDDPRWSVTAAFFDYDEDGWLDLWVVNFVDFTLDNAKTCVNPAGTVDYCAPAAYTPVTDSLFHNRGDGTFERVSSRAGIDREARPGLGAVAADFDNDGWLDLYVANDGMPNQLYLNNGDGTFREDALLAGCSVNSEGASEASMGTVAADFDNDGDEDLFLTHLTKETNTLYLNDGRGFFTDGSDTAGLAISSWNFTGFGAGPLDFDSDGLLDLLVVNGTVSFYANGGKSSLKQPNQLFRNVGGNRFEAVEESALETEAVSRGSLFGDIDNDGDTDVVILNNDGPARLLLNRAGDARDWLGLRLIDARARRDVPGAKCELVRGEHPSLWRRAHTDGGYASAGDPRVLFGLGLPDELDGSRSIRIERPNGRATRLKDLPSGRYIEVALRNARF